LDKDTGDVIKQFPVMDVSFTTLDSKDSKTFSFITSDTQFGLMYVRHRWHRRARLLKSTLAPPFAWSHQLLPPQLRYRGSCTRARNRRPCERL
jgi:hypothetical protein